MKKNINIVGLGATVITLILIACQVPNEKASKPNVILIISDQWSTKVSDGSGNYDNGILTPGIDLLAKQGISFKQAYSTYPLCTPARASLFTGLYSHHNDVGFNLKKDSILARAQFTPTLGKSFKEAGYNVAYFGKEHAGGYGYASATEFGSMTHSNGGMLAEVPHMIPFLLKTLLNTSRIKRISHFL